MLALDDANPPLVLPLPELRGNIHGVEALGYIARAIGQRLALSTSELIRSAPRRAPSAKRVAATMVE